MTAEPEQYLSARLRRALAEDPRTTEQGVRVTVRGDHVMLSGTVASADRREALEAVIHDVAPDLTVFDDVKVVSVDAPAGREELR
ncbi:BON domain-containing protein [Saccharothrix longispora]|uniref:BON domain-containing protein n=1 Tax=Saccharothrix longispora TaxID=33920 RepID=UPI0028FDAD8D|nr:BON domain-containing protein [Saccharothrix longispora]MDU0289163.1 BON domain-containing protein [Saccharothrix longispora]